MGIYERASEIRQAFARKAARVARNRKWLREASQWKTWYFDSRTNKLTEINMSKSIQDLMKPSAIEPSALAAEDTYVAEKFPNLYAMLTTQVLGKGKTRTPSTLFIFAGGGVWKICLGDKDGNRCLWAESDTVAGLTAALELLLDLPQVPWKAKTFTPQPRR